MTQDRNPQKAGFYDHEFEKLNEKKLFAPTFPAICFIDTPPPLPSHDFLRPASFPFDHTRHTEAPTQGASKMRRDSINGEVMKLRDLLPLPPSTRSDPTHLTNPHIARRGHIGNFGSNAGQGCATRWSLGAGLRGNGERMRK